MRATTATLTERVDILCRDLDRREPLIRALVPEPDRRARLRAEAELVEQRWTRPDARPALYGVLVGVKDVYRVAGLPTRCGSELPEELFAGPEASLVGRLRAQGAVVLGKTVTTEFAYFEPGPTRNPRNPEHTPGGSSSGSAAAVAAGYCPLALGTQTVGSVIRPAAYCGIAGFKPGFGVLPLDGVIPYAPTLDHAGFFVPTAADLPAAFAALSGLPPAAPPAGALGVPVGPYLDQASPEARAAFEAQCARLAAAGWEVREVPAFSDIDEIARRHHRLAAAELAETHREWFPRYESLYRPRTAAWIREGLTVPAEEIVAGRASCVTLHADLEARMDAEGLAAWISPAACGPAPRGLASTGDPAMNLPWTHAGLPTAVIPAGAAANGLPLGLQIAARRGADGALAALAASLGGGTF